MQENSPVSVEVDDIYVMAFLIGKGYTTTETQTLGGRVSVRFDGEGVSEAISEYYEGGMLPCKKYAESYMRAKDLVFDALNNKKRKEN